MPRGPFVPIPNTFQVKIQGHNLDTLRAIDVILHAKASATPSVSETANVATQVATSWTTSPGRWPTQYVVDAVQVTDLNSSTGPQVTNVLSFVGSGGDMSTPGTSLVVELFTTKRGKSYTGRAYLPFVGSMVDKNGNITFGGAHDPVPLVQNLQTALAALTPASSLRVASRKLHIGTDVSSIVGRASVGYVRRRLIGG